MIKSYWEKLDFEMTPIIAYGLIFIAFVLALLGLESWSEANRALKTRAVAAQTQFLTMSNLEPAEVWEARLAQSTKLREAGDTRFWTGATTGVIAAEFQQDLRRIANRLKMEGVRVVTDAELETLDGVDFINFEFYGQLRPGPEAVDLFTSLGSLTRDVVIKETVFSHNKRDQRPTFVRIAGLVPVKIVPPGEGEN